MDAAQTLSHTTERDAPALTAADRCDYCGARAWVRVTLESGELLFCAHHAREHMSALSTKAISIQDERSSLFEDERALSL